MYLANFVQGIPPQSSAKRICNPQVKKKRKKHQHTEQIEQLGHMSPCFICRKIIQHKKSGSGLVTSEYIEFAKWTRRKRIKYAIFFFQNQEANSNGDCTHCSSMLAVMTNLHTLPWLCMCSNTSSSVKSQLLIPGFAIILIPFDFKCDKPVGYEQPQRWCWFIYRRQVDDQIYPIPFNGVSSRDQRICWLRDGSEILWMTLLNVSRRW